MSLFSNSFENRHYGLDVIRAISLIMILIIHCMIFVGAYYNLTAYLYFGVLAVELFFALSGFLIGTILLKITQQGFSKSVLINFWLKRWARTLPAYFFVIAVIMLINREFYWSFLVFLQNYNPEQLNKFPVSWTISLEEWFYITFPFLLFLFHKTSKKHHLTSRSIFLYSTLIFVFLPLILRILFLLYNTEGYWDYVMRKSIFIRFDNIGYGLLLAWINYYYADFFYRKAVKYGALILSLIFLLLNWWIYLQSVNIYIGGVNWVNSLIVFPMVNWVCAFAIIYALSFKEFNNKILARIMTTISITSYSLYLIHFQFFVYFARLGKTEAQAWFYMALAVIVTFIVGFALNMTVEKYFINKRNKWIKQPSRILD